MPEDNSDDQTKISESRTFIAVPVASVILENKKEGQKNDVKKKKEAEKY